MAGRAVLSTGRDADALTVTGGPFGKKASLRTGAGDDQITLAADFAAGRSLSNGPGDDALVEGVYRGFNFRDGEQGWVGDFADYAAELRDIYHLDAGLRPLPAELSDPSNGFLLSGANHSDELFMFLKRRLGPEDGVTAGQAYQVGFDIKSF